MSITVSEDKRTIANTESKARELDAKIKALLGLEKDIRSCIEQLQIVEKEMKALDSTQKDYAEIKDLADLKTVEKNELLLKKEVG
jgi:kinetochore protein Nuf2